MFKMPPELLARLMEMQAVTLETRKRLDDATIGNHVKKGRTQIIRVTYDEKGVSTVTPLSAWFDTDAEAISFMRAM